MEVEKEKGKLGQKTMQKEEKGNEKKEEEAEDDFLLSFPWVVHDVLCEIKKDRNSHLM